MTELPCLCVRVINRAGREMLHRWSETWFGLQASPDTHIRKSSSFSLSHIAVFDCFNLQRRNCLFCNVCNTQTVSSSGGLTATAQHVSLQSFSGQVYSLKKRVQPEDENICLKFSCGLTPLQQSGRPRGEYVLLLNLLLG